MKILEWALMMQNRSVCSPSLNWRSLRAYVCRYLRLWDRWRTVVNSPKNSSALRLLLENLREGSVTIGRQTSKIWKFCVDKFDVEWKAKATVKSPSMLQGVFAFQISLNFNLKHVGCREITIFCQPTRELLE